MTPAECGRLISEIRKRRERTKARQAAGLAPGDGWTDVHVDALLAVVEWAVEFRALERVNKWAIPSEVMARLDELLGDG